MSIARDLAKRVRDAKKGQSADIMKDIEKAFKDKKIRAKEFDELSASCGRKMDQLGESLSVSDGIRVWIENFKESNDPQLEGKSDVERRDAAIAAYLTAKNPTNEAFEASYDDVMGSDEDEVSNFILARRRHMRRTDTTGGNNDEYL